MESADSGLDSRIVPSSHHPMTLPRMNKVNPDTATARPEAVKDWMVMVKKNQGQDEPIKQQSYDVYFFSTVCLRIYLLSI